MGHRSTEMPVTDRCQKTYQVVSSCYTRPRVLAISSQTLTILLDHSQHGIGCDSVKHSLRSRCSGSPAILWSKATQKVFELEVKCGGEQKPSRCLSPSLGLLSASHEASCPLRHHHRAFCNLFFTPSPTQVSRWDLRLRRKPL